MSAKILDQLFEALPHLRNFHAPTDPAYGLLRLVARREVEQKFAGTEPAPQSFGPFGDLRFPYEKMGAINSLDLFGIDELVILSFYWRNRQRYRKTLDMGANLGLHSIIMSRCGFDVTGFEPDPHHFELLTRNLKLNDASRVTPVNAAVSTEAGTLEFVRVKGNTTGSHLAGSKTNVYGEIDKFPVKVLPFAKLVKGADFVKLDIEGHEKVVLSGTDAETWQKLDMMAEIGSPQNADAVYEHFKRIKVGMFAQKINWRKVERLEDMPTSHRDGSLFITMKSEVPW